jgi:hypothetical protein
VAENGLALPVRRVELLVGAEDRLPAGVETEVDGPALEMFAEIFVVVLALLPAGGDGGDLSLDPELGDGLAQGRVIALSAQENDGGELSVDHEARTFNVRPTKSSIERSVS